MNEYEMCSCNHFGGSTPEKDNSHETYFQQGHGHCKFPNCRCEQFTWVGFCDEYGNMSNKEKVLT